MSGDAESGQINLEEAQMAFAQATLQLVEDPMSDNDEIDQLRPGRSSRLIKRFSKTKSMDEASPSSPRRKRSVGFQRNANFDIGSESDSEHDRDETDLLLGRAAKEKELNEKDGSIFVQGEDQEEFHPTEEKVSSIQCDVVDGPVPKPVTDVVDDGSKTSVPQATYIVINSQDILQLTVSSCALDIITQITQVSMDSKQIIRNNSNKA